MKKLKTAVSGILIGIINILVGSCGGIVAVESLKNESMNQTKAHATAVAVILPLTAISAAMYMLNGNVKFSDSTVYLIPGVIGSVIGSFILPKIPRKILGKIFSVFIIYAGIRMILK